MDSTLGSRSVLDPAANAPISANTRSQRQRIITTSPPQQQSRIANVRSIGKVFPPTTEYSNLSRATDEDSVMSSIYDDHSMSAFSQDDGALRDRENDGHRTRIGSFGGVPEMTSNDAGFFLKDGGNVTMEDELHQQVPVSKYEELELRITRQPEEQHRARYMSEGSRGSVKDRSGKSHVTVALRGHYRPTVLEIFAAIGSGPAIPHPLYRLIPVTGKNGSSVTSCKEGVTSDGAPCLQVVLRPENKMTAVLDCIGILKICSYDLKRKLPKQNRSASVRLVFRVTVPANQDRRQNVTLQTVSFPVVCAQQPGYPDISRISCTSSSVRGNVDVFIVGKNFSNNAAVYMKEYGADGKIVWCSPAAVDQQHIHTCHMICTVPPYRDLYANKCVEVMLTVECGKKISRPLSFKYLPDNPIQGSLQAQQQPIAYNPSYTLDGIGGASTTTGAGASSDSSVQQAYWPAGDFTATGMQQQTDQQYQQQRAADQPMLSAGMSASPLDQQASSLNLQQTTTFPDFLVDAKPEPFATDEQNASLYYSNQFDKPPAPKRPCTEGAFNAGGDQFFYEDLPQLLT